MKPIHKHLSNMRNIIGHFFTVLLMLLLVVSINNCSDPSEKIEIPEEIVKNDPPDNEKPDVEDPKDKEPTERLTVNKTGGTITKDNIKLIIPADAFANTVTMDITVQSKGSVMEDYEASEYYKIKLPRNFSKPLKIELPANTEISEGDVYFRFSAPGVEISSQKEGESTVWIKGEKEGDNYTATLYPFDDPSNEVGELIVGLVKDYESSDESVSRAITNEQKCVVYAPRFFYEEGKEIAQHIEESIKRLEAIGFSFAKRNKQIQVEIKNLSKVDVYGYFIASRYSSEWNSIVINTQKLSEKEEMKRTIIHEMTHFVQYYYDPRWAVSKSFFGGEFLWMDEAVATWAESLYVDGVSLVQLDNQFCPTEGFWPLEKEDDASHGYGMASLVSWLANRYGNDKIVNLHKQQEAGAKSVYDAFNEAYHSLFIEYLIFLKDYIRANGLKNMFQSITVRKKLEIDSMNELKSREPIGTNPYSTFIERISINPNFKLLDGKVTLSIKLEGGMDGGKGQICELYRFTEKKEIIFVDEFFDSYQYEDVATLQDNKETLFVVYYHPFNKASDVTMTVRLEEKIEFKTGKIKLQINELNDYSGFFTATFPDELVVPIISATGTTSYSKDKIIYSSNSSYSKKESNDKVESSWEISIEVDAASRNIVRGTAQNVTSRYNDRAGDPDRGKLKRRQTTSFAFRDIPFIQVYASDGSYRYGVSDSNGNIGNYTISFNNKLESEGVNGWTTKTVTSWKTNTKWSVGITMNTK